MESNREPKSGPNIFSIDVEDFFHASALKVGLEAVGLKNLEHRVVRNTSRMLELLAEANVSATFFVLGWVVERYPRLVRQIAEAGHEIACHGYSHTLIYDQTPAQFREETVRAKEELEEVCGVPVIGYRAASFSINSETLWALEILADLGFRYDSSIYPVRHDLYGIPDAPTSPHIRQLANGNSIVEVPMSVAPFGSYHLPISGGGYFRLFPYRFTRWATKRLNRQGSPLVFYIHPWEIDPDQPKIKVGKLATFRHYNNLDKTEDRLRRLFQDFEFESVRSLLSRNRLLKENIDYNVVPINQA